VVEGLVAALLLREAVLAHDAEGQRGHGRQEQGAPGCGQHLGREHRHEGSGRQEK
jgi:hypothetical protein